METDKQKLNGLKGVIKHQKNALLRKEQENRYLRRSLNFMKRRIEHVLDEGIKIERGKYMDPQNENKFTEEE